MEELPIGYFSVNKLIAGGVVGAMPPVYYCYMTYKEFKAYVRNENSITPKELRRRLMEKDPHCYWCGREVVEYPHRNLNKGEVYPDDKATIEHLYDRFDIENRYKVYPNHENKVLACYRCNYDRAKRRVNAVGKKYLLKRQELAQKRRLENPKMPRAIVFQEISHLMKIDPSKSV